MIRTRTVRLFLVTHGYTGQKVQVVLIQIEIVLGPHENLFLRIPPSFGAVLSLLFLGS